MSILWYFRMKTGGSGNETSNLKHIPGGASYNSVGGGLYEAADTFTGQQRYAADDGRYEQRERAEYPAL